MVRRVLKNVFFLERKGGKRYGRSEKLRQWYATASCAMVCTFSTGGSSGEFSTPPPLGGPLSPKHLLCSPVSTSRPGWLEEKGT